MANCATDMGDLNGGARLVLLALWATVSLCAAAYLADIPKHFADTVFLNKLTNISAQLINV